MKNIIAVVGGLGNQMFQYAFSLTLESKEQIYLNDYLARHGKSNYGSELENVFEIRLHNNCIDNFLVWFLRKCVIFYYKSGSWFFISIFKSLQILGIIAKSDYLPELMKNNRERGLKTIWYGRFQSESFFKGCEEKVKDIFSFNLKDTSVKTRQSAGFIEQKNSISLHVRRGDYLNSANISTFSNICTIKYYQDSIQYLTNKVESPIFIVFSDDLLWVRENIQLPTETVFVDWNIGNNSWEDMFLMTLCKHNIVANSTFSWWGAWLNRNPDKIVLCPPKYTNMEDSSDFYPKTWIRIYP